MRHRLVVIVGSSGVGKTTLARALQEELLPEQWLHFSVDTLFHCLPMSIVERVDHQNEHRLVDARAIVTGAHACVATLLQRGHRVIFDTVIMSASGAQSLLAAFTEFGPHVVEVLCSWEAIRTRTLARADRTLAEAEHGFRHGRGHISADHVVDSSEASPQRLAREVAERLRMGWE